MYILFDLDDTIYNLADSFTKTHKAVFPDWDMDTEAAFPVSRVKSYEAMRLVSQGSISKDEEFPYRVKETYAEYGFTVSEDKAREFERVYREFQGKITIFDGMAEVLSFAKENFEGIRLFTNGRSDHQRAKAASLGMGAFFADDEIFVSEELGYFKPDIRAFEEVEKRMGMAPDRLLMIGDTYSADIESAIKRGWKTIWFDHRYFSKPVTSPDPDHKAYTPADIEKALKNYTNYFV